MGLLDRSQLIKEELLAIEQLTYYYYPVLVCRLYGFAQSSMIYLQNGFNRETFGRVAFVFSFDSRENLLGGRLCAACINQKLTSAVFEKNDLDLDLIQQELCALPGVIKAEILECKIWDDYFPCLPWNVRVQLEKQQFSQKTQTLYLGGYTLGCFEDLASVAAKATETIDRLFDVKTSLLEKYKRGFRRFMYYLMSGDGVK